MTGSSHETTKLIVTAVGAAITGAAIGIAVLKYTEKSSQKEQLKYHIPKSQRSSLVFAQDESESGAKLLLPHNHEEKMRRTIAARALVEEDNFHPRDSVTVRVPATSANMGPGCKCYLFLTFISSLFVMQYFS
jgi:hypothetical protein